MAPLTYPENPTFRHNSERQVYEAILPYLADEDAVFTNLELTDAQSGDIEIDMVVLIKDRGCIVIETKGGNIAFDGANWIQSDPSGSREIYPGLQSKKNMYAVRDYIRKRWSQGQLKTEWVVAFPNSNVADNKSTELPKVRIIDRESLPNAYSQLRNILAGQNNNPLPQLDSWVEVAVKHLIPLASTEADPEVVLGNNYEYIRELTHQRRIILDQLADNQRVYVHGPAGSGKTWLAFEKAIRWTREGKKVGIVAFNTGLLSYMQNKTTELPENERPAWIGTFHAFATKIGSTAGSPNFYREPVDRYGPALLEAVNKLKDEEKFDAWIIDEAQDFRPNWWEVLMLALRDVERGGMYLFGDDQQMVFGPNSGPQGFFTHFRLFENIRNSQQIAAATESLLKQPVIARGPFSFPIEFIESTYEDAIERADDVIESLTDKDHWRPGEIALLTTKHQHPVQKELTSLDRSKYWQSLWAGEDVFYCTVGGFKGLERPVVVLAIDGFHEDASENEFLYTGITRARDRLVIVGPKEIARKIQIESKPG